jgi:hypothetical protein
LQHRKLIFRQFSLPGVGCVCQCIDCKQAIPLAIPIPPLESREGSLSQKPAGSLDDPTLTRVDVPANRVGVPSQPRTDGEFNGDGLPESRWVFPDAFLEQRSVARDIGMLLAIHCAGEQIQQAAGTLQWILAVQPRELIDCR